MKRKEIERKQPQKDNDNKDILKIFYTYYASSIVHVTLHIILCSQEPDEILEIEEQWKRKKDGAL